MTEAFIHSLRTLNQFLTAGIAITALSLLVYALTFNLRDRVARSFALILACVVVVFTGDAIASVTSRPSELEFWLRLEWIGIVFLPATYLHFSDAILSTTGRPSRGRRRLAVQIIYAISWIFLLTLPFGLLIGPLVQEVGPAPHLERTPLTWVFTGFYAAIMLLAGVNLVRSFQRTVTSASRRRMAYLLIGGLAPALGSYPYLLFGSGFATRHQLIFWLAATLSNLLVSALLIIMAYAVAFFGVTWPDRVVKQRLFKWLMRGPVTASSVLVLTTLVRRLGERSGLAYSALVPVIMVAAILLFEHLITLFAPFWERWLFHGRDRASIQLLQNLEERMLTSSDLRQFLESILAAACDRLQVTRAFIVALGPQGMDMVVTIGDGLSSEKDLSEELLEEVAQNGLARGLFSWGEYWLVPLFEQRQGSGELLGLLGTARPVEGTLDEEQEEALSILADRAALALEDRSTQQNVINALKALTPEVEYIQRMSAAIRYSDRGTLTQTLTTPIDLNEQSKLSSWVKDALTHYWGGPKLTQSPLLGLRVVQRALDEHDGNPTNALRGILRQAIEHIRPEGERRFTGEWILYNILEMKFLEGHKVREVALRLAMSEADLYRKQRVAIEAVANAIIEMEQKAIEEHSLVSEANT
jgi:hypothetical protein